MTFPVDDIVLGPASFGRIHRLDAIFGHTGEEPGFTRDHAVATAIWQRTHPGSYSFRIYDAASKGSKGGVMLNVPYLEASGGINPLSTAWAPERFPWIERELAKAGPCPVRGCAGPYRNPTMHAGQISFTGRKAELDAGRAPANYLPDAKRLIAWYENHPRRGPAPLVIVMHGHLQTNRTDWGTWMQSRLTAQEDEMSWLDNVRWYGEAKRMVFRAGASYRPKGPTLDDTGRAVLGYDSGRDVIGEVDGFVLNGNGLWYVIGSSKDGDALAVHSQDKLREEDLVPASSAGGVPKGEHEAALEQISALTRRVQLKDRHIAGYPKG